MKEKKYNKRLVFSVTDEMYDTVEKLAAQRGCKIAEVSRDLLKQSLDQKVMAANMDLITNIIKTQVDMAMKPHIERLASLEAKTAMASATSMYLTAETLEKFVAPEERVRIQDAYNAARKKASEYIRGKSNEKKA